MTDELQRNVGGIASHMAVHLPNPCDRDHCRQDAMPRESHSLKPLCTTSVTALLFRTQEKPLQSQSHSSNIAEDAATIRVRKSRQASSKKAAPWNAVLHAPRCYATGPARDSRGRRRDRRSWSQRARGILG
ncbi:uncharacterized protein LOC142777215 [Rhipicephalus microplus]|uniref:uncharacterized protein LOC142777215 n=1 Tax=Rhipicephalus microplus TaxID=6941 RepID=UPI003F6CAA18